jgi:homoserine O-succinyltransferase
LPVLIDVDNRHQLFARARGANSKDTEPRGRPEYLNIGLINNMPDSALVSTERQLFNLLDAASEELFVKLHFYYMEPTPRSEWGRDYLKRYYRGTNDLLNHSFDGIIVTGAEPKASKLTEEPYWLTFCRVVDWAKENTRSSIYSCLAVHGAVLHSDGLEREALPEKCIGVFLQKKAENHPLTNGLRPTFKTPHSRWNVVSEANLADCRYSILSRSVESGVDCFVKQQNKSLFVYFQGHPEYETLSLLGEYRRDIGRFLRRESDVFPTTPKGYLNSKSEQFLNVFRCEAIANRSPELLASFPIEELAKNVRNVWQSSARKTYRNWLSHLAAVRADRSRPVYCSAPHV